jgi:hypothetical protein
MQQRLRSVRLLRRPSNGLCAIEYSWNREDGPAQISAGRIFSPSPRRLSSGSDHRDGARSSRDGGRRRPRCSCCHIVKRQAKEGWSRPPRTCPVSGRIGRRAIGTWAAFRRRTRAAGWKAACVLLAGGGAGQGSTSSTSNYQTFFLNQKQIHIVYNYRGDGRAVFARRDKRGYSLRVHGRAPCKANWKYRRRPDSACRVGCANVYALRRSTACPTNPHRPLAVARSPVVSEMLRRPDRGPGIRLAEQTCCHALRAVSVYAEIFSHARRRARPSAPASISTRFVLARWLAWLPLHEHDCDARSCAATSRWSSSGTPFFSSVTTIDSARRSGSCAIRGDRVGAVELRRPVAVSMAAGAQSALRGPPGLAEDAAQCFLLCDTDRR